MNDSDYIGMLESTVEQLLDIIDLYYDLAKRSGNLTEEQKNWYYASHRHDNRVTILCADRTIAARQKHRCNA